MSANVLTDLVEVKMLSVRSGWPTPHQGMPALDTSGPPLSRYEFWPMWAFYWPIAAYCLGLMLRYRGVLLPTAVNPRFPGGGFFGESKSAILRLGRESLGDWVAPFVCVTRQSDSICSLDDQATAALQAIRREGLSLPCVAKPDLGCRGAGVQVIRDWSELRKYLGGFPEEAVLILQQLVAFEGEAGIFYCRRPGEPRGRVVSITLKYFPYVIGDGEHTLKELILADTRAGQLSHLYLDRHFQRLEKVPERGEPVRLAFAGSHSRGAIFRDGTYLSTPALEERIESLARRLPDFQFGRFDVRFASIDEVLRGGNFTIVEINGAGAESTHIWDRRMPLRSAWMALFNQYRWLFEIGADNRSRGVEVLPWRTFYAMYRQEKTLTPRYPPTQ